MSPPNLHTVGIRLYDSGNNEIVLNGITIHYGGGGPQHVTLTDIQNIRAMGFRSVRLFYYWGLVQPSGPTSVDSTIFTSTREPLGTSIDNVVDWCAQNNLYIILCPCWTASFPAPSWATSNALSIISNANGIWTGINTMYRWIAQHYASQPHVLFESFNEMSIPSGSAVGGAQFKLFNESWVGAIEEGEGSNSHLKIIEFLTMADAYEEVLNNAGGCSKPNVVWASHNYSPLNGWIGSPTQIATRQQRTARCAAQAHNWNQPIMDTEWGKNPSKTGWQSFYTTLLNAWNAYGYVGWSYFTYCPDAAYVDNDGANIRTTSIYNQVYPVLEPYLSAAVHPVTVSSNVIAPVTVDGAVRGNTPLVVQLPDGPHTVSVPQSVTV